MAMENYMGDVYPGGGRMTTYGSTIPGGNLMVGTGQAEEPAPDIVGVKQTDMSSIFKGLAILIVLMIVFHLV